MIDKQKLYALFQETRKKTLALCDNLTDEEFVAQPIIEVSPPKWHLGHTTWFFEEFILSKVDGYKRFSDHFAYYFNSYYNNIGDRITKKDRGGKTEPCPVSIRDFRAYVDEHMGIHLDQIDDYLEAFQLGINHEQQHQELLTYDLKKIGSLSNKDMKISSHLKKEEDELHFIPVEEGVYEVGYCGDDFCYDNELGKHKTYIHPFEIASRLVTNGEYIDFIEAGGYKDFNLWHADGWDYINKHKILSPYYWTKKDGEWFAYTLEGLKPVDKSKAVNNISFYEAFAYACWKGMRLPTEFEWEVASDKFSWGNLWEWTNSAYLPYPKYQKAEGAIGEYNGKFMVNCHVLRGASFATPTAHSRKTYRNFFYPSSRWQFSGIRLVK